MKIPLPARGQPIDAVYLHTIATAVNELANQVSSATFNFTTVDTPEAGRQAVQTAQAMIHAGSVRVTSNEHVIRDTGKQWHIDLPPGFKFAPSVTATVVNVGATTTGNDVTCTVTNVTKSRVDGTIKFASSGTASIDINVQAIGIPE